MDYDKAIKAKELIELIQLNEKIKSLFDKEIIEVEFKCIDYENKKCHLKSFDNGDGNILDRLINSIKDEFRIRIVKLNKELNSL